MRNFPFTHQPDAMDRGPACLSMIAEHYGKQYTLEYLRDNSFIGRDGVSLLGISKAAENIGFKTVGGRLTFDKLAEKTFKNKYLMNKKQHTYIKAIKILLLFLSFNTITVLAQKDPVIIDTTFLKCEYKTLY